MRPHGFDDAMKLWARRFLLRAALAVVALLALLLYAVRDRHPVWTVGLVAAALVAWTALRFTTLRGSVFIAAPRSAVLPVLQKTNHGATDTVDDGLLVHAGRWSRPPVHVRPTGDGVLLTTTRTHARRLRRLL